MKLPKHLPKKYTKYASSPTFEGIKKQVARFFCDEEKELRQVPDQNIFTVHSPRDGRNLGMIVVETARGFYFCAALN